VLSCIVRELSGVSPVGSIPLQVSILLSVLYSVPIWEGFRRVISSRCLLSSGVSMDGSRALHAGTSNPDIPDSLPAIPEEYDPVPDWDDIVPPPPEILEIRWVSARWTLSISVSSSWLLPDILSLHIGHLISVMALTALLSQGPIQKRSSGLSVKTII